MPLLRFTTPVQGFRQQTAQWPARPLDAAIARLKQLPASFKVADFGCGDAELAASVPQQVASFDLVACAPGVIACNMAHVPLGEPHPGGPLISSQGQAYMIEVSRVQFSIT